MSQTTIHIGDALEVLRTLPDECVHCVVTSPPYWGLRDYGVDGQIGLEETFAESLGRLVEVFREVRRVLRDDGTCWINMGDSYAGSWGSQGRTGEMADRSVVSARQIAESPRRERRTGSRDRTGLAPKNLLGQPWRLAFALQDHGWILRQDIIWHKPSPMPESVRDRCTKAHEYVFLMTKRARYAYNGDAIREPVTGGAHRRGAGVNPKAGGASSWNRADGSHGGVTAGRYPRPKQNQSFSAAVADLVQDRNARSVWTIQSQPFPEAHFATFPPELPRRCIEAGTSRWGCCSQCGAPRENIASIEADAPCIEDRCDCNAETVPCTVLDPFGGAGTTALVANRLGRDAILIELSPEYAAMAAKRIWSDAPLFHNVTVNGVEVADER